MENNHQRFTFDGKGLEVFKLYLVNLLLTFITLGVYYFWASVKTTKYFYNHTVFMNGRFEYHVTGKEKFIAFLKGLVIILIGVLVIFKGIPLLLSFLGIGPKVGMIVSMLLFYVVLLFLLPAIIYGSKKFRLARSSWNAVHFRYSGKVKDLYQLYIKGIFLTIVTLGIYSFWFGVNIQKYHTTHSAIGNASFDYDGKGSDLLLLSLKGIILTFLTLGIYYFWFVAALMRYDLEHSSFQGNRFKSDITGGGLIVLFLKTFFVALFTLGFGLPWAVVMAQKYITNSLSIGGNIDLAVIQAAPDVGSSALADGMAEAGDFFDMIGEFFV